MMIGEMMNETTTTIFLTPLQAQQFLEFQKNHAMFVFLLQNKVFDIRSGAAVIHFDHNGIIGKIERNDTLFDGRVKSVL